MKGGGVELRRESAETLAIEALGFIAGEPEALAHFIAASGIGLATLRRAAADPAFLAGVLDFLLANEPILVAFAGRAGIPPERIGEARRALSSGAEDRRSDPDRIPILKPRGGPQVRPGLEDDRPEEA